VGYTNGVSLVSYPRPYYPPEARSAGMQGTVLVWLKVSTEGKVVEARVEQSCGYAILDNAAVRFAYTVRLQPARQGAIPVVAEAKLPVAYRLID
jgi:protein TonB